MSQETNSEEDRANAFTVLKIINQKEAEIRQQIVETQQRAAASIQAAHEEAEQRLAQAEEEARAEAERLYQDGLKEANEKAEILLKVAHEQAASLRHLAQARRDEAAAQLVRLILPEYCGQPQTCPRA
jgi:vacuolar-type H+-ATPase subunit H